MKAIQFDRYGEPTHVLALREIPQPEPGENEVRVRIQASPINPADLLLVRGIYSGVQPIFPSPIGFEGVGFVDKLGAHVHNLTQGQRVVVLNIKTGGNWAEYAVLPPDLLIPVPDDLSTEQAASFFVNPSTAIVMLRYVLAVPKGEWLLQSAASSELGRMIIKLAKHDGIRTINVVRRRAAIEELKQLGADIVITSEDGPVDEQVRKLVDPQGVKYAVDPVAGDIGTQVYQSLSDVGHMLLYGSLTEEPIRVGADPRFTLAGNRILEVFWLGRWIQECGDVVRQNLFHDIVDLMREGVLGTTKALPFPLREIRAAATQAEQPSRQGKVLLIPAME